MPVIGAEGRRSLFQGDNCGHADAHLVRRLDFLVADAIRLVRMVNQIGRLTTTVCASAPFFLIPPPAAAE